LGAISPNLSLGVNFPSKNLFSQIISQLPNPALKKSLSEIDPMESLGNVTAPLDSVWEAIGSRLKVFISNNKTAGSLSGPLKSSPDESLTNKDTSATTWFDKLTTNGQVLGIAKSTVILIANILIAVLEIVLWVLRGLLKLVS